MKTPGPSNMRHERLAHLIFGAALVAMLAGGCQSTGAPAPNGQTMADALTAPRPANPPAEKGPGPTAENGPFAPPTAIATINGKAIPYAAWINLLKRTHGLSAFQYILGVELARQAAQAKGIVLTEDQLEQALRQEIAQIAGPEQDPTQQQRLLEAVLARRGITMDEFRLLSRRNTYLRRIVEPIVERSITDDALTAEFDRLYGEKVQVRHIQLASGNDVLKVQQALDDGMDFPAAARQFSQNVDTAPSGGQLPPFGRMDPAAPPALRELAFATEIGKTAGPVRIDNWSHIILVEARIPAQPIEYKTVAGLVRLSLKEQLVLQEMQKYLADMLQSAVIQIQDPNLSREFQALRAEQPAK